jgi:hypothetical protein
VIFLFLAVRLIPTLGLQNDETLFASGIYAPRIVADWLLTPAGRAPLMQVSYTGSLKTWLFALIFAWTEPSIWSVRRAWWRVWWRPGCWRAIPRFC